MLVLSKRKRYDRWCHTHVNIAHLATVKKSDAMQAARLRFVLL